jgi:hypothetical protein
MVVGDNPVGWLPVVFCLFQVVFLNNCVKMVAVMYITANSSAIYPTSDIGLGISQDMAHAMLSP